jgi:hypothetical protein
VVTEDACSAEEERVDYEPSPDGTGEGASLSDQVGLPLLFIFLIIARAIALFFWNDHS